MTVRSLFPKRHKYIFMESFWRRIWSPGQASPPISWLWLPSPCLDTLIYPFQPRQVCYRGSAKSPFTPGSPFPTPFESLFSFICPLLLSVCCICLPFTVPVPRPSALGFSESLHPRPILHRLELISRFKELGTRSRASHIQVRVLSLWFLLILAISGLLKSSKDRKSQKEKTKPDSSTSPLSMWLSLSFSFYVTPLLLSLTRSPWLSQTSPCLDLCSKIKK